MCLYIFGPLREHDLDILSHTAYMSIALLLHVTISSPMSEADTDRLRWSQLFALRITHEATLQTLLGARNYAVLQLLQERNNLLRERYWTIALFFYPIFLSQFSLFCNWRVSLGGPSIVYSDTDFITPVDPEALLPYIIAPSGAILPFRSGRPSGGFYPGVVRMLLHAQW